MTINKEKIKTAIAQKTPIEVETHTSSHENDGYFDDILSAFLEELNLSHLHWTLSYSLRELLGNANKANIKRIYFKEKDLDIDNVEDYKKGMETFSLETTVKLPIYQELLAQENYSIKMILQDLGDSILLEVKNNSVLTTTEKERILERIERSKKYNSMEDALSDIDRTEGSGLGIIIILLMLRKLALSKDCFSVECTNGETVSKIVLRKDAKEVEERNLSSNDGYSFDNRGVASDSLDDVIDELADINDLEVLEEI
ncbi:MAG: hypothetical protein MJ188_06555 [Treponema sp.]|nr:hypothetical protein [Treponema sp.]